MSPFTSFLTRIVFTVAVLSLTVLGDPATITVTVEPPGSIKRAENSSRDSADYSRRKKKITTIKSLEEDRKEEQDEDPLGEKFRETLVSRPTSLPSKVYTGCNSQGVQVRYGPDYSTNRLKKPSAPSMFHLAGTDLFKYDAKLSHICQTVALPELKRLAKTAESKEGGMAAPTADGWENGVPDIFVVNFLLPMFAPALSTPWSTAHDGEGASLAFYFYIKESTRAALRDLSNADPSIRLLKTFMEAAKNGHDEKSRLKAIPKLINEDEIQLDSMMRRFNGKPFLTGPKYHTFHAGPNYLECDVDIHSYCYPARKVAFDCLKWLPQAVVEIAFVVEARHEAEMPEQIIGGCCISNLNPDMAKKMSEIYPPSQES